MSNPTVAMKPRPFVPQAWARYGLCQQVGGDWFFPELSQTFARARRICRKCPVRAACLQWALDTDEPLGMWGGKTPTERRELARDRASST